MELKITKKQADIWVAKCRGEISPDEMAKEIWKKLSVFDYVYKWGGYQPVINIDNTREHCLYHVLCMIRVGSIVDEKEKEYYINYWERVQKILRNCLGEDFKKAE